MAEPKYGNKGKKRFRPDRDEDDWRRGSSGSRKGRNWQRYDPEEFEDEEDELVEEEAEIESL